MRRPLVAPGPSPNSIGVGLALGLALAGCGDDFGDDYNLVGGLRLVGVVAEPAEVAAGETASLDAIVLGADPGSLSMQWFRCTDAALPSQGNVNPDCLVPDPAMAAASPFGTGTPLSRTIDPVAPGLLGNPDYTSGVYLPLRLHLETSTTKLDAVFRYRYRSDPTLPAPRNTNPVVAGIYRVTTAAAPGAVETEWTAATPIEAHLGDTLNLRARFTAASAEPFEAANAAGGTSTVNETLSLTWFSTAGHFGNGTTGDGGDTTLDLSRHPPATGDTVSVVVVGRDERGGSTVLRRSLHIAP